MSNSKQYIFPNKIEGSDSPLELEIIRIVDKALKERLIEISSADVKLIAKELMPDIDEIVSRKVKQHFYELGVYMAEKFK
jgi:hypothetical protein